MVIMTYFFRGLCNFGLNAELSVKDRYYCISHGISTSAWGVGGRRGGESSGYRTWAVGGVAGGGLPVVARALPAPVGGLGEGAGPGAHLHPATARLGTHSPLCP